MENQGAGRKAGPVVRVAELEVYNTVRSELKLAIRKAQEKSWADLCRAVDSDPWGIPYKLVTRRLGRRTPTMDQPMAVNVARGLPPPPRLTGNQSLSLVLILHT